MTSIGASAAQVTAALEAAVTTPAATDAVATAATDVAHVAAATRGGMSSTGMFGLSAGAAGLAITMYNTWRDSVGAHGFQSSTAFGPTTFALGGGSALLLLAEKGGLASGALANGMRGAGIALVLGGLAGAIAGAVGTFGTSSTQRALDADPMSQKPARFPIELPAKPQSLEGIELARAGVITTDRKLKDVSIYGDPTTATAVKPGTSLTDAVSQARALAQGDANDRSEAVVQTADGKLWIMQLAGDLDQVDGRHYADGNTHDRRYPPTITKQHTALQAIVGIEHEYVFPAAAADTTAGTAPAEPTASTQGAHA